MSRNMQFLPELEGTERCFIQDLIEGMSTEQAQPFASAYRGKKKDPHTVLLTTIVGLVAIPGLQRFWLGQIGMGFLYLLTLGLFVVGTIVDLVNQRVARQIVTNTMSDEAFG